MSRIGKAPVAIPGGVEVTLAANQISIKGPLGTLTQKMGPLVEAKRDGAAVVFATRNDSIEANAMSGTLRATVNNMVQGVTKGFSKKLTLVGVGYRAQMKGQTLSMQLGFSHDVDVKPPQGITFAVPKQTEIRISGIDKQAVGELAARIRRIRPPEPYKGKGVRYAGEKVRRKEGKKK